jgi:UPF0271 protein
VLISSLYIDLNCDMGEGMDSDAAVFPFITSANIACGGHAGDDDTMRRTVELAMQHGVAIGAHPSYPDRENFGRVDILDTGTTRSDTAATPLASRVTLEALPEILGEQLQRLAAICREFGVPMRHVKPHGALYNRAAKDAVVSKLICNVILDFNPTLLLYGLSGSEMRRQADGIGLRFISEVFADRTYQPDGSLTPRTLSHALIDDPAQTLQQVLKMVKEGRVDVYTKDGIAAGSKELTAETICLHGDGDHAAEFAQTICHKLSDAGIQIRMPS